LTKIRDNASNPKNFYSYISLTDDYVISDKFFIEIKKKINNKYSGNGEIVDIKAEPN